MAKQKKANAKPPRAADDLVGKRVQFDRATWDAVDLLAREQMKDIPEITEEAFRDLLKKYGRSADFRESLKMSARRASKEQVIRPGEGTLRFRQLLQADGKQRSR